MGGKRRRKDGWLTDLGEELAGAGGVQLAGHDVVQDLQDGRHLDQGAPPRQMPALGRPVLPGVPAAP
ncbi:hypothetical protein [Kitasatospora sp. NPDC056800]|uniref:hypothetical protein n=1 Tax=Kitasatospora sp. NPDC056800 TaxID=3345948 RepID=UPI0036AF3869